jgi:hypothetical protein
VGLGADRPALRSREVAMNARRVVGVLLMAAAVIAGCNNKKMEDSGESSSEASVELVAQARPPIPDLPVPIGFDLDQRRSRNLAAAGVRWIDHLYKGKADKFSVARFYRRQMPLTRWTLVTEMFAKGNLTLDFERQADRCHVTMSDGSLFHPTYVHVELWTAGRVPTPPSPPARSEGER